MIRADAVPAELRGLVYRADNMRVLPELPEGCADLIYLDPPFNTGKVQRRDTLRTRLAEDGDSGDRTGFQGKRYATEKVASRAYEDSFDDYLGFLEPRLRECHRLLAPTGSLYFHIDYREVHYCKLLLDQIFGREAFINEIIWAYDYGARTRRRWPAKHDNILFYAKDPAQYSFNVDDIDRIPYMAPGLVGPEKAARGKLPTDTWWHTIVSPTGKEKLGYPTQKPLGILQRIVRASSPKGGLVLDAFAGSGTTGAAALSEGRRCLLIDQSEAALAVMRRRFATESDVRFEELA